MEPEPVREREIPHTGSRRCACQQKGQVPYSDEAEVSLTGPFWRTEIFFMTSPPLRSALSLGT